MAIKNKKIAFNNNGLPSLEGNNLKIVPPNSLEAEKALISSILIDNSQVNSVLGSIMPEDFYDTVNARIFKVLISLGEKGEPIDIITILNAIQKERDYSQYF